MNDETKKLVAEFKLGLKIVLANFRGAMKIVDDVLATSKDKIELDKAMRLKQKIDACLCIINEK